jgi:hypothetical protein
MGFSDAPFQASDAPPHQQEYYGHKGTIGEISPFAQEIPCGTIRKFCDNAEQVITDGDDRNAFHRFLQHELLPGAQYEGCNEYLVITRPELIRAIHEEFLNAGADIVETNSFGSTALVLAEYGLQAKVQELNVAAARVAREACARVATPDRPRFVAGSMGPTTKAMTVTGGVTFDEMIGHYRTQAIGLLSGGADTLLLETTQDTRNLKAGFPQFSVSPGNYLDYRDHNHSFSGLAALLCAGALLYATWQATPRESGMGLVLIVVGLPFYYRWNARKNRQLHTSSLS